MHEETLVQGTGMLTPGDAPGSACQFTCRYFALVGSAFTILAVSMLSATQLNRVEAEISPGAVNSQSHHMTSASHLGPCDRPNKTAAVTAGSIDAMFQRATAEFGMYTPRVLHQEPWLLLFESFLTAEEVSHLQGICYKRLGRSLTADYTQHEETRTSSTCWCAEMCSKHDATVARVTSRISDVTMTPHGNAEYLQVSYCRCGAPRHLLIISPMHQPAL